MSNEHFPSGAGDNIRQKFNLPVADILFLEKYETRGRLFLLRPKLFFALQVFRMVTIVLGGATIFT